MVPISVSSTTPWMYLSKSSSSSCGWWVRGAESSDTDCTSWKSKERFFQFCLIMDLLSLSCWPGLPSWCMDRRLCTFWFCQSECSPGDWCWQCRGWALSLTCSSWYLSEMYDRINLFSWFHSPWRVKPWLCWQPEASPWPFLSWAGEASTPQRSNSW